MLPLAKELNYEIFILPQLAFSRAWYIYEER
jgi:hypothetical protein